jgi:exodeoxyribonuclease V beta subunit
MLEWLLERLRQPLIHLDGQPVHLDRLEAWRTELEFWLPATAAWSEPLDRLVTRLEPLPGPRPRLAPRKLNGMLKGYIDLVFQAHGRWYVLDWKSNHLGDDPEDYQGARLSAAMVDHRYDLQYVLYVLALHRLLKSRLEDYDYDRHVGGACYVFLRGLSKTSEPPLSAAPLSAAPLSAAPLSAAPLSAAPLSMAPLSMAPEAAPGSMAPEDVPVSMASEVEQGFPMAPEGVVGSSANGVFYRRPSRALIEALDAWLDGDAEPARALIQQNRRQPAEADS